MVRTQISLTPEQHAALTRMAAERGTSMSAIIRDTIDRLLELSGGAGAEGLLGIAGIAASGCGDLAERHDDHLGDAGRW